MLRRHTFLSLLILLVFAFPLCLEPADSATFSGPSKAWKLAFVRSGDIWIANGDGTGQHKIISNGDVPCWSPNKTLIAFERNSNIWIAHADGANQHAITHRWKPLKSDEGYIAGVEEIGISWDKDLAIFYSHGRKLTTNPCPPESTEINMIPLRPLSPGLDLHLDYSEEGTTFAFSDHAYPAVSGSGNYCAFACNGDLWIAIRDQDKDSVPGWDLGRLKAVAEYDEGTNRADKVDLGATHISWSPDEHCLAYSLDRLTGSGLGEIHLLRIQRGRGYTPTPQSDRTICDVGTYPSFSPDGKWIAYWTPSTRPFS